ncbi:D-galacturonic acid reductase [Hyphodiscus hymeniophilus]|uniref:D-galacturonic acid reductase n=1 Tax=Hyphodiscus hymeniophilus TaxID=353542 RepID=A0A9P7AYN6_9HELO|nr:D-galacturonic acid reductase [Hyphodiscus hymeniophilus]
MADTVFTLNTGAKIPALGFGEHFLSAEESIVLTYSGTWQSKPGEVERAVEYALLNGYRHIDAAYSYGNEEEVGVGLRKAFEAGLKREDVFVTTKLWSTHHNRVQENLEMSLRKLGLDYVDLYLMHWPVAMNPNGNHPLFPVTPDGSRDVDFSRRHVDTYLDMEKLAHTGKVKTIGVANYSTMYLEELLASTSIVPAVNQIENHPLLPQDDVLDFCKARNIHITAYSPLGSTGSPLLSLPVVEQISAKHGVSRASILLSYHRNSVLAKSVTASRIKANRHIIKLDSEDTNALAKESLGGSLRRFVDPQWKVNLGFPDKQ